MIESRWSVRLLEMGKYGLCSVSVSMSAEPELRVLRLFSGTATPPQIWAPHSAKCFVWFWTFPCITGHRYCAIRDQETMSESRTANPRIEVHRVMFCTERHPKNGIAKRHATKYWSAGRIWMNGDNLRISRAYLRISDHCRVTVRVRVMVRVTDCCIQTSGESDKNVDQSRD